MTLLILTLLMSVCLAMFNIIWFKKNAIPEYLKLFGLGCLFHINTFFEAGQDDPELTYTKFLAMHWNNWLVRLVTCPICLTTFISLWLNLALYSFISGMLLSLLPLVLVIPGGFVTAYASLYLYFKLVKLIVE